MATGVPSAPSTAAPPSATESEFAASELPLSEADETGGATTPTPAKATFPPYPPYATTPAPPSVKDAIYAGREIRVQHKSVIKKSVRPVPKPARPKGPKATDVKSTRREMRAHARCLRRHGAVLTDRLERMAKPQRRTIIYLWREHAGTLPEDTINRLRNMLEADEPFKPDQAYEYFVNLRKTKKKTTQTRGVNQVKKDLIAVCADKRFVWARNATVAFARGIQQRLRKPGRYALADAMLRLSDIVLDEICSHMNIKKPSRRCTHPKARFMMEMADKVAVWIDEILAESDDRMLMMDFDEDDEEVARSYAYDEKARSEISSASASASTLGHTSDATPGTPATPAAPGTPAAPATPAASVTPATPATPVEPATPAQETPGTTPAAEATPSGTTATASATGTTPGTGAESPAVTPKPSTN